MKRPIMVSASRRTLSRLLVLFATLLALAPFSNAQTANYYGLTITSGTIPAGSNGATVVLDVTTTFGIPSTYKVCFFTGYGASGTPITPTSTVLLPGGYYLNPVYESTFNVPASSIQSIPPSAFSAATPPTFNAIVYAANASRTTCTSSPSTPSSSSTSVNAPIVYPTISSILPTSVPQRNPNLSSFLPPSLDVRGANFLTTTTGSVSSVVNFTAGTSNAAGASLVPGSTSLRTTIPPTLPASAASATLSVCNQDPSFSYCSNSVTLPFTALAADPGTLSASPSPAASGQAVTLTANFGGSPSVAGVPSGTVTFLDGSTAVGSAPLILNPDAVLVATANPPTFSTGSNTVTPGLRFVSSFNANGLKDLLFIDNGPSAPTLHFLFATSPTGGFAPDAPYTFSGNYPCTTVLSAAVADFNDDGFPNVAVLCNNNTAGYVLYTVLNNGDGTFNPIPRTYTASTLFGTSILAGDFNADGKQDVVVVGSVNANAGSGFATLLGAGDGTFTAGPVSTGLATEPSATFGDYQVLAADMNADGLPDIAVLNGTSGATGLKNQVQIFRNTGGGTFVYSSLVQTDGTAYNSFAIQPMTLGNAYPDLIVIGSGNSNIPGLSLHFNQKTAAIAFSNTGYLSSVTGTNLQQAVFGDFNGDGKLDAAVYDGLTTKIYAGDGTLFFAPYFSGLSAPTRGASLIAAPDLNLDGFSDLLTYSTAQINAVNTATVRPFITSATAKAVSAPIVLAGGSHTLTANAPGNYTIAPGSAQTFLTVALATPDFVCSVAPPTPPVSYGTSVSVSCGIQSGRQGTGSVQFFDGTSLLATLPLATGSGPNSASYTSTTFGAGTHNFSGRYTGDSFYAAAQTGAIQYTITAAPTSVTYSPAPSTITYGTPLAASHFNAVGQNGSGSAIPGTYTYNHAVGDILPVGNNALTVTFSPTDTADYLVSTAQATVFVSRQTPILTWPTPAPITQGTPLSSTQLNATAANAAGTALPGTFTYNPGPGSILPVGTTPITVTFQPTDSTNYTISSTTVNQVVRAASTTTTLSASPTTSQYGQTVTFTSVTNVSNSTTPASGTTYFYVGGEVLFGTSSTQPAVVQTSSLSVGTQNITSSFQPNPSYAGSGSSTQVIITRATTSLVWSPNPATIVYGTPLSAAQLNATASTPYTVSVPGTIVYSPAAGTVLSAGPQTLSATFTPTDTTNYTSATRTVNITVARATPVLTYATPAPIQQGTALSSTQLNATAATPSGASLPGTFTYSPAAGTVLPVGTTPITATFTPTDTVNYSSATATVNQVVNAANTTTTLSATPSPSQYGQSVTLSASTTASGSSPASGTVRFYEGEALLGTSSGNPATLQISTFSTGPHNLAAVFLANANFAGSSATTTLTVLPASVSLSWTPSPATIVYGTPLSAAQLNATASTPYTASVPGTITYSPVSGTVLSAGPQTLSATFTPTDTANYTSATRTVNITVTRATPVLTYATPAPITQGTPLSSTQLNATAASPSGASLPGTFTYSPAAGTVLPVGTTPITATFTPTDTVNFNSATATVNQVVNAANTTTTLSATPSPSQYGQSVTLSASTTASGSSPASGTVRFYEGETLLGTSTGNPATIQISTFSAGLHNLAAVFVPNANFAGSSATTALTVLPASVSLSWNPSPATIVYGTPLSAAQLNATASTPYAASVPGTITYSPAAGTVLSAGSQTLSATFTPTDTANFTSATRTVNITVARATPVLTYATPAPITQGTPLSSTQLNASAATPSGASLPGTFTYSPAPGTVLPVGTTPITATFIPTDTVNFNSATATVNQVVNAANTTTTLSAAPSPSQYGQPITLTANTTANGSAASGTVNFFDGTTQIGTSTGNPATLQISTLTAGQHTLSAVFQPNANFAGSSATTALTVLPAAVSLTWNPSPATIVYGTPLSAAQLNATSSTPYTPSVPGSIVYSPAAGTVLSAGPQTLSATFTPTDAANYTSATRTVNITVTPALPVLTFRTPSPISQGTALSSTQLNATAADSAGNPIPGTFTYSPAAGAVLPVGSNPITVTFLPTDAVDFNSVTATVNQVVTASNTTTTLSASPSTTQFGQSVTLTASSLVTGSTNPATGTTNFFDGTTQIGTSTASPATLSLSSLSAGTHTLTAVLLGSTNFGGSTSPTLTLVVAPAATTLAWTPTAPSIVFGTPLTAAQLNATASTPYTPTVPGTITYSPVAGTILPAGSQTLSATFTPTDTANFSPVTRTVTITVTRATPSVTWPTPAPVPAGTALSSAQLNATASGVNGQPLPGVFAYTPPAGTVLNTVGTSTLNVLFTPTDILDYNTVPLSVPLTVTTARAAIVLSSSSNPVVYGQPLSLTATVTSPLPAPPTGTVTFYNGTAILGTAPLVAGVATLPVTAPLSANTYNFTATYSGDAQNAASSTLAALKQVVSPAAATITWIPNPASIVYGTPLSAAQLNASSSIPGTFAYTPASGTILSAGTQILAATFTPTDTVNFKPVSVTASITVTQATPTIVWATPAAAIAGSTLSATQLNASALFNGQAVPGTFVYTPAAGTILSGSTITLNTVFTPTDRVDFTVAQATVNLTVTPVTLTSLSSTTATLGDPAKTITLTGTGFIPSAIVQVNGSPVVTSFVNSTTLTAVIPAANLLTVGTLQVGVVEAALNQTTATLPLTVTASQVPVTLTTPPSTTPGAQVPLAFQLASPYPADLTVTLTLGFTPASGLPDDPTVQFPNGTRAYTFVVPANSTSFPPVPISTGTVAGTITFTVKLSAGGTDVTPASLQVPRIIQAPVTVPGIASAAIQRDGKVLTLTIRGFSNDREITGARFHFNAAEGFAVDTHDITIDVTAIFAAWFSNPTSTQYGSTFTYTQPFNLNTNAAAVGSVTVTLVNAAGASVGATTP